MNWCKSIKKTLKTWFYNSQRINFFFCYFFQKVSYLLEGGSMAHEDFCGHVGKMNPGDLQVWPWQRIADRLTFLHGVCLILPTSRTLTLPPVPSYSYLELSCLSFFSAAITEYPNTNTLKEKELFLVHSSWCSLGKQGSLLLVFSLIDKELKTRLRWKLETIY